MAHRKKRGSLPKKGAIETPGWLLTFGDLNSLLLTFFVLLISLSVPVQPKMKDVIQSFNNAFGSSRSKSADLLKSKRPLHKASSPVDMPVMRRSEFQREVEKRVFEKGFGPNAQFDKTPEGFRLRLSESLLFDGGSYELKPDGVAFLGAIAPLVRGSDFLVRVEGHSDAVPFASGLVPSNWELSALRATTVVSVLEKIGPVDPEQLTAVGYGEHRPIAPNDTPENRAKNRRVEIHFMEPPPVEEVPSRTWTPGSGAPMPTVKH